MWRRRGRHRSGIQRWRPRRGRQRRGRQRRRRGHIEGCNDGNRGRRRPRCHSQMHNGLWRGAAAVLCRIPHRRAWHIPTMVASEDAAGQVRRYGNTHTVFPCGHQRHKASGPSLIRSPLPVRSLPNELVMQTGIGLVKTPLLRCRFRSHPRWCGIVDARLVPAGAVCGQVNATTPA